MTDPLINAERADQNYAQQVNNPSDPRVRHWLKRVVATTTDEQLGELAGRALRGEADPYDVAERARSLLFAETMRSQLATMTREDLREAGYPDLGQELRDRLARTNIAALGVPPELVARAKAAGVWPDEHESLLAKAERMEQVRDLLPEPNELDPDRPEED